MTDPIRTLDSLGLHGESWRRWVVFAKALFCQPLSAEELTIFHEHAGHRSPPTERPEEVWIIAGRRSGKSWIVSRLLLLWAFFYCPSMRRQPGERLTLMCIASDRRQATQILNYVKGTIDAVEPFKRKVVRETQDEIELEGGIVIGVYTCSMRAVRGYTVPLIAADETAFWKTEDDAVNVDREVLTALRPAQGTCSPRLLIACTTPYAKRGEAWRAFKEFGKEGPALIWTGESLALNPTLDPRLVERALEEDPSAARSEWLGQFRDDVEDFISEAVLEKCTVSGRTELPPASSVRYSAFVDVSAGSQDSYAWAIGHRDARGQHVLDLLREVKPPFSPEETTKQCCLDLARYDVRRITGDRVCKEWAAEQFRKNKVELVFSEKWKSELYQMFLALANSGKVELLDSRRLRSQLLSLQRHVSRSGQDSIDSPGHEDAANVVAGVLSMVGSSPAPAAGAALSRGGAFGSRGEASIFGHLRSRYQ